jgi:hypothetical protein
MGKEESLIVRKFRNRLEKAKSYGEIWEVVKDSAKFSLNVHRRGMMLFLDNLPIQVGAYHPVGTNNIVLNKRLVQIVEATLKSKCVINALIYNLLLHEYLHALGQFSELRVREMVYKIARKCFGDGYIATEIAKKSPWALLKGVPLELGDISVSSRVIEIVKDFEQTDNYVV